VLSVLLGGGRGNLGDVLVQLIAVALLIAHVLLRQAPLALPLPLLVAIAAVLVLPLLHLLPLTTGDAGALRAQLALDLELSGSTRSPTWSLYPLAAERALWSLLPAVAMCMAVSRLGHGQRRVLLIVLMLLAMLSILIGMAQLADGEQSLLRLHSPTNISDAVGFFANRNHLASLLVATLPFAMGLAAWVLRLHTRGNVSEWLGIVASIGATGLLILGILLARSRAGVLLGMLAVLFCLPLLWRWRRPEKGGRALISLVLVVLVLTAQLGLYGILQRLKADPLDDGRWQYARVVSVAAQATAPWGSGLGTFAQVYPQYEAETGAGPGYAVVNHAHNDVLELWLESGKPFIAVAIVFAGVLVWIGIGLLRPAASVDAESVLIARLAAVSTLLLLLHSCLDYPLRTTALMTVFAMLLALCVPPLLRSARR
jgi:O-antigen ligase